MTDLITHSPATVAPGGKVTICYTFPKGGPDSVTLKLDYSDAPDTTVKVTRKNPCVTKTVPDTATSLIVIDESGQSEDHDVPIS